MKFTVITFALLSCLYLCTLSGCLFPEEPFTEEAIGPEAAQCPTCSCQAPTRTATASFDFAPFADVQSSDGTCEFILQKNHRLYVPCRLSIPEGTQIKIEEAAEAREVQFGGLVLVGCTDKPEVHGALAALSHDFTRTSSAAGNCVLRLECRFTLTGSDKYYTDIVAIGRKKERVVKRSDSYHLTPTEIAQKALQEVRTEHIGCDKWDR